jgi:hypothetical protein
VLAAFTSLSRLSIQHLVQEFMMQNEFESFNEEGDKQETISRRSF